MLDHKETSHSNRVISLEKTVMKLLEFKVKSEAKISSLQQEVKSLKQNQENAKQNKKSFYSNRKQTQTRICKVKKLVYAFPFR